MNPPKLLLPTNDLVFKMVLERSLRFLSVMLSAILDRDVEVEEVLNPGIPGEGIKDKLMHLDLRVRFADGSRAFVEMQAAVYAYLRERFLAYLCRDYSSQLRQGMPYSGITSSIGVIWHVGAPYPEYGFHDCFRLRGDRSGQIYSDALSLHVLQLGLAPRRPLPGLPESETARKIRLCARFLAVKSREELTELEQEDPIMTDVANTLRTLSADPEVARLALEREEAEYFYELALKKERELGAAEGEARGKAEGEARGKAEGEARGEARGKAETVLKLIQLKFGPPSESVQQRVRSASLEELHHG